jgi:hypothetical protein
MLVWQLILHQVTKNLALMLQQSKWLCLLVVLSSEEGEEGLGSLPAMREDHFTTFRKEKTNTEPNLQSRSEQRKKTITILSISSTVKNSISVLLQITRL